MAKKSPSSKKALVQNWKTFVQAWKSELTRRPSVLWRYTLLVTVFWVTISIRAYQTFLVHPADWLEYGQRLHSLWQWVNRAGGLSWNVAWLAPVFRLFPYGQTLLVVQAFLLASGGIAAYLLAGGLLPPAAAGFRLIVPLLYWLHFPIYWSLSRGFHEEMVILPLVLWGLALLEGRSLWRVVGGWLLLALGLTLSPLGAAVGAGIAVVWILEGRKSPAKLVRGVLLLGLSPFLLIYKWPVGWSLGFHPDRLLWLAVSWGVLVGLPLMSWRHAVGAVPVLAFTLIVAPMRPPIHWILVYSLFGFWSMPEALPRLWGQTKRRRTEVLVAWGLAMIVPMGLWMFWDRADPALKERSVWLSQDVFHTLSQQGSWRVPEAYLPALARRETIATDLATASSANCVILDTEIEPETRSTQARLMEEGFHEAWTCREFVLLERGLVGCLSKRPECR